MQKRTSLLAELEPSGLHPDINYFAVRIPATRDWVVVAAKTAYDARDTASLFFNEQGKGSWAVQDLDCQYMNGGIIYALSVRPQVALNGHSVANGKRERITGKRHSNGNRK